MGKKSLNRLTAVLLLALFCSHFGSVTLFPHTHVIDGVVICHSHPYSGSADNPGHSHTTAQYDTIAQLSALVFVLAVLTGIAAIFLHNSPYRAIYRTSVPSATAVRILYLRGPPAC